MDRCRVVLQERRALVPALKEQLDTANQTLVSAQQELDAADQMAPAIGAERVAARARVSGSKMLHP